MRQIWRKITIWGVTAAILMWLLLYSPTPFVVYEPGIAVPVQDMVEIKSRTGIESNGELLLTAVRLTEPNLWNIIKAVFDSDKDVVLKRAVFKGESKEQYAKRISSVMSGSQSAAIEAAYKYSNVPYENKLQSIYITGKIAVSEQQQAKQELLQDGDQLLGVEGEEPFSSISDMVVKLQPTTETADFQLEVVRANEVRHVVIQLNEHKKGQEWSVDQLAEQLAVESFIEKRKLVPLHAKKTIEIKAKDIGGPSAGLVFALTAIDLLTDGDLTEGLTIAATGTIDSEGNVGAIGGIKQKTVITSREGADLFIVPKANEQEALRKAKRLKTKMQIVGVETLAEAIAAIQQFEPRR